MAEAARSPVEHMRSRLDATMGRTAALSEVPCVYQTVLRGDAGDDGFRRGASTAIGVELPTKAGTTARWNDGVVLCLGPDEWLLIGVAENAGALSRSLREALTGQHVAVVDTSAARVVLQLSGPDARRVLESGCSLDLHPRAFRPGHCARTVIGTVEVILVQREDGPVWWLLVPNSYAEWFTEWLLGALLAVEEGTDRGREGYGADPQLSD